MGRTQGDLHPQRVSIVIPIWRDTEHLAALLPNLVTLPGVAEIIVVNASRDSESAKLAERWGATLLRYPVPNRGAQLNRGAEVATGDVLLFHHADCDLYADHLVAIQDTLRDDDVIGGAFHQKSRNGEQPRLLPRNGILHGDQSIFVRRDIFDRLGGFPPQPIMEDIEFSKRLRRAAGLVVLLDPPIPPSVRRRLRRTDRRTKVSKGLITTLYNWGVSPARLHRWYYQTSEFSRRADSLKKQRAGAYQLD